MKRMLTAVLALSLLGGAAASAQDHRDDRRERGDRAQGRYQDGDEGRGYRGDGDGRQGRRWVRGQRLPDAYRSYGIDYRHHNLRRPPRGYQWVQVNGDYVLSAVATGLILDVISGGR